jgi:cytochrome oxidase Cu insertion factor (SCO1/SenC/PrrC family)
LLQADFAARGLEAVSITCDPARDTPSSLATYAKQFNADSKTWHFLTWPDFDYIKRVANEYFRLPLERLTHSDQVVLFRRDGTVQGVYTLTNASSFVSLLDNIEKLLSEPSTSSPPEANSEIESGGAESASG